MNPFMNKYLGPFISLSYPLPPPENPDSFPNSSYYGYGIKDACLVLTAIAVLALLREVLRLYVLEPFARSWVASRAAKRGTSTPQRVQAAPPTVLPDPIKKASDGADLLRSRPGKGATAPSSIKLEKITKQRQKGMTKEQWLRERSVLRFAEQGWSFVYYSVFWSLGFYLHLNLPHSLWKVKYVWIGYPHPLPGAIKLYYITQFASWLHQALILNAEARRKDHWQMMSHHVITIALMLLSYITNFTRVGSLILVLMDWCDIWLSFAKMMRYLGLPTLCDAAFVMFIVSWFITRQVLYLLVIASCYFDARTYLPDKWEPEKGYFFNGDWHMLFVCLMSSLQIIMCVWFVEMCRVAWKVARGQNAEDTRSDEEGESPEEDNDAEMDKPIGAPKKKAR